MNEPLAYLNGRFVLARDAVVSVQDAGFVLGATVSEQLRTFGGRLFRAEQHFDRLAHSLAIVGVPLPLTRSQLAAVADELVAHNHRLLDPADDLGLSIFVTPGPYATLSADDAGPTLGLHTYPLPFRLWADKYTRGQHLVVPAVEQVSPNCWPPELKCRSRMHYYLADRAAREIDPDARALLVDAQGRVSETATANVLVVRGRTVISPPRANVLPGISLDYAVELAGELGWEFAEESLDVATLAAADEVLLTSTPHCLLGVTQLDGRPMGPGVPGPLSGQLLERWSAAVGVDIVEQSRCFATRT